MKLMNVVWLCEIQRGFKWKRKSLSTSRAIYFGTNFQVSNNNGCTLIINTSSTCDMHVWSPHMG